MDQIEKTYTVSRNFMVNRRMSGTKRKLSSDIITAKQGEKQENKQPAQIVDLKHDMS